MNIDNYYPGIDKNNFYLGMISQVYRSNVVLQVENLSLLSNRKIKYEFLVPNTINFFVVIDSAYGLFLGEIYQSKVLGTDSLHKSKSDEQKEQIYPEISIDIIGLLGNDEKFKLTGFKTVGITDKVFIANRLLVQKYLNSIEINDYEKEIKNDKKPVLLKNLAEIGNFDTEYLSLNANTLFDRHLMAIGTTNSGKSTSALSILDKLITSGKKVLMIDPTGEYEDCFKEKNVIKLKLGKDATLSVGKVKLSQWESIFETNENTQGATLNKAIRSLRYQKKENKTGFLIKDGQLVTEINQKLANVTSLDVDFDLSLLPGQILEEAVQLDNRGTGFTSNSFNVNVNNWLFEKVQHVLENSTIETFFVANETTDLLVKIDTFLSKECSSLYIDASQIATSDGIGSMIIDLICNYIINKNSGDIKQPFILYIDEVHRYMKSNQEYKTGLTIIAREGRKKGIFLFLTTQNPKDVPEILLGQVGSLIIHRLTHSEELRAIQNLVKPNTLSQIQNLNQGEAILTSINLIQDIHVRFIRSNREHKNGTPIL